MSKCHDEGIRSERRSLSIPGEVFALCGLYCLYKRTSATSGAVGTAAARPWVWRQGRGYGGKALAHGKKAVDTNSVSLVMEKVLLATLMPRVATKSCCE